MIFIIKKINDFNINEKFKSLESYKIWYYLINSIYFKLDLKKINIFYNK